MDTKIDVSLLPNGTRTVTTGNFPEGSGNSYEKVLTEYYNGTYTVDITETYGDTTIVNNRVGSSDGDSEFIQTETSGMKKVISMGSHDKDFNLTSLQYAEYFDTVLTHMYDDKNGDGNPEYEAFYTLQGEPIYENYDSDSDGEIEILKYYNEDGTEVISDRRSLGEKLSDFFSDLFNQFFVKIC